MSAEVIAGIVAGGLGVLAAVATGAAAILGIRLRTEADTRRALEQQVYENKRVAYSGFHGFINDILAQARRDETPSQSDKRLKELVRRLFEIRKEIWTYGSPDVVRAYSAFNQYSVNVQERSLGGIVLVVDLILTMRTDMGLSNKGLSRLDVLRMFINDVDDKYREAVIEADTFLRNLAAVDE